MHKEHERGPKVPLADFPPGTGLESHPAPFTRPPAHELVDVAGSMLNDLLIAGFTPGEAERIGVYLVRQATTLRGGKN